VAPLASNIVSAAPRPSAQRGLVLIAKVLQNVANNMTFGSSEPYLEWMNDFISTNFLACQDYFDDITLIPKTLMESSKPAQVDPEEKRKALLALLDTCKAMENQIKTKYQTEEFDKLMAGLDETKKSEDSTRQELQQIHP